MTEAKATCIVCGAEFLQRTAELNDDYCLKCKPSRKDEIDHEDVADKLVLSFRLIFAIVFAFVFAGLGYGAGATIWSGIGVILALITFPIGAIYGFFIREINSFIRMLFRSIHHFDGD